MPLSKKGQGGIMRTTVIIDDKLVEQAKRTTGITKTSALIDEALHALIRRENSVRLVMLGGSMPGLVLPDRRRARR
jgi:Arc/MetJ family transcription regulator